ncbi:phosphotransferase, partial [Treponema pallidum]
MGRRFFQIFQLLRDAPRLCQRDIAKALRLSLAYTNRLLHAMESAGLLETHGTFGARTRSLTPLAHSQYQSCRVHNAVIMAAGFGSRCVPLTYATPKGLLKVFGEPMIERQIRQLHEVGITDITVVVGYLKEAFEYLVDKHDVTLTYNPDYETANNLSTLYHARHLLRNTYILSSDNWLRENIYHSHEWDSWYTAVKTQGKTKEWVLKTGLYDKITAVKIGGRSGWIMYGPAYFSASFSKKIIPLIEAAYMRPENRAWFWEDVFMRNTKSLTMFANKQADNLIYEFESLDELRKFDFAYMVSSDNEWMRVISHVFNQPEMTIGKLRPLKAGMTNKSFIFELNDKPYLFRIPGEGTELLVNRFQEAAVYEAIKPLNICDTLVHLEPARGIKITVFHKDCRSANPSDPADLDLCMRIARKLHQSGICVAHRFDFRSRIAYYEKLALDQYSILYADYRSVREKMNTLLAIVDSVDKPCVLTHVDLTPDNFLLCDGSAQLIDWEYAGMCDPLVDIAMFSLYAHFNTAQIEDLMYRYFQRNPHGEERLRVFCYIALGGFLWSLWTSYKQALGISFGDYGL